MNGGSGKLMKSRHEMRSGNQGELVVEVVVRKVLLGGPPDSLRSWPGLDQSSHDECVVDRGSGVLGNGVMIDIVVVIVVARGAKCEKVVVGRIHVEVDATWLKAWLREVDDNEETEDDVLVTESA
eukprot:3863676-Amphidinium_carterae.2